MLEDLRVAVADPDDGELYSPPSRELSLTVIGGQAHLRLLRRQYGPAGNPTEQMTDECAFWLPARSLLLALRAAWDDDQPGTAWCDAPPSAAEPRTSDQVAPTTTTPPRPRAVDKPRPPHSHEPWTETLDQQLRGTWLASAETTSARETIAELAQGLGRSAGVVRSRLARLGCDPDVPGRTLGAGSSTDTAEITTGPVDERDQ